jgi:hypothetical protein
MVTRTLSERTGNLKSATSPNRLERPQQCVMVELKCFRGGKAGDGFNSNAERNALSFRLRIVRSLRQLPFSLSGFPVADKHIAETRPEAM